NINPSDRLRRNRRCGLRARKTRRRRAAAPSLHGLRVSRTGFAAGHRHSIIKWRDLTLNKTNAGSSRRAHKPQGVIKMLRWAFIFLVIALVAALFGFTGIAAAAAGIAKFLFFLFLVVCLIFFIIGVSAAKRLP